MRVFADPRARVLVGAVAVGPQAAEWLGQLTLAVRSATPVDVLLDTIQPYPTFSEAIFFALRELGRGALARQSGERTLAQVSLIHPALALCRRLNSRHR